MDRTSTAISQLANIHSALSKLDIDLRESEIEPNALSILRNALRETLSTVDILRRGMEASSPRSEKQALLALLVDERLLRAAQLNAEIAEGIQEGIIRTDQEALSTYLRVLSEAAEKVDLALGSRKVNS